MSILEEQIGEILNKQGSENRVASYCPIINNGVTNYLLKIGNPKSLEFVNPIFDTG